MPRRRTRDIPQLRLQALTHDEAFEYPAPPPFASTPQEVRLAVEQNALERGILLMRVMVSQQVDAILEAVDTLAKAYDLEDYHQVAEEANIAPAALNHLSAQERRIPYPYYFCLPETLIARPDLIFYYRNVAMLSSQVMRGIGLDTQPYELQHYPPDRETATALARYFNAITSNLVLEGGATTYRHIEMMMANLGDSLGGVSRNEVGRIAMTQVIDPLIRYLIPQGRLSAITFSLKGRLVSPEDDEGSGASGEQRVLTDPEADVEALLRRFEEFRVIYHRLDLSNGSRLLMNRQLTWEALEGSTYRIGPDLHSQVGAVDMHWAAELKGGADPSGSDEHWKTATQSFQRVLEAAQKTNRPQPKLSFIATILVERVAREAQNWINDGRLTSVYNLTKMYQQESEMRRYLEDMTRYLGFDGD